MYILYSYVKFCILAFSHQNKAEVFQFIDVESWKCSDDDIKGFLTSVFYVLESKRLQMIADKSDRYSKKFKFYNIRIMFVYWLSMFDNFTIFDFTFFLFFLSYILFGLYLFKARQVGDNLIGQIY